MANGQQSKLKALFNNHFSLILLDGKRKGDKCSINGSRRAKIGVAFSEDVFLIIWSHWPNLCFPRTSVGVYGDDHIGKNEDNPGTNTADANSDGGADNLNTDTANPDGDRRVNNIGISTIDTNKNKGADNLSTGIVDIDRVNNFDTDIVDADEVDDLCISIADVDRDGDTDDPGISTADIDTDTVDLDRAENSGIDRQLDGQVIANDATCVSLFSLCRAFFLWLFILNRRPWALECYPYLVSYGHLLIP